MSYHIYDTIFLFVLYFDVREHLIEILTVDYLFLGAVELHEEIEQLHKCI